VRRGRINIAYRNASLTDLSSLVIAIDPGTNHQAWSATLQLCDRFGLIRICVIFWTCVCFLSASSACYPEDGAGAQATAHSERIKAWSAAKRFQAISQASMISARVRNTELASQWLRR
jgi:hypothetical protein